MYLALSHQWCCISPGTSNTEKQLDVSMSSVLDVSSSLTQQSYAVLGLRCRCLLPAPSRRRDQWVGVFGVLGRLVLVLWASRGSAHAARWVTGVSATLIATSHQIRLSDPNNNHHALSSPHLASTAHCIALSTFCVHVLPLGDPVRLHMEQKRLTSHDWRTKSDSRNESRVALFTSSPSWLAGLSLTRSCEY